MLTRSPVDVGQPGGELCVRRGVCVCVCVCVRVQRGVSSGACGQRGVCVCAEGVSSGVYACRCVQNIF